MKIKDLQFARHFLLNEIDLPRKKVHDILGIELELYKSGEPDTVVNRGSKIVYYNPSSVTKFLYSVFYNLLSEHLVSNIFKDKLGLALLGRCKEYVYSDFETEDFDGPPVLLSFEKLPVPNMILSEIIEPLIGKIKRYPVFFMPCKFTDTCRVIESQDKVSKQYDLPRQSVQFSNFPVLLSNCNIYNSPAKLADITTKTMQINLGEEKASEIMKSILLDKKSHVMEDIISLLHVLRGEATFVVEFLDYLSANTCLSNDEVELAVEIQAQALEHKNLIRLADNWSYQGQSARVDKQWSQWSMMLGLIEKQLAPMRGSMWPATENLKPIEDRRRSMILERTKKKGSHLTFEELLEIAREEYDHTATPGTLLEKVLKDNRVWS